MRTCTLLTLILLFQLSTAHISRAIDPNPAPAQPLQGNKEVTVNAVIRETLDKMVEAYQNHNINAFMAAVSEEYIDGKALLERRVQKDFSTFTTIGIRYTFDNITPDDKGKVSAAVSYTRFQTLISSGQSSTVQGKAELLFSREDGSFRLQAMKKPPLFGIGN